MSVYTFITQPFRYAEIFDQTVRAQYTLARSVEIEGRFTNLADAQSVGATLADLLKAPRVRFEVPVLGVNVVNPSMFDGQTPCAILSSDRFNLQAGRLVLIPDFTLNLNSGQTVLRCWG